MRAAQAIRAAKQSLDAFPASGRQAAETDGAAKLLAERFNARRQRRRAPLEKSPVQATDDREAEIGAVKRARGEERLDLRSAETQTGSRAKGGALGAAADADGDSASDAALLARFCDGDQRAARALIERHAGRVLALGRRMLGDADEAEDVAQEAMVRLWRAAAEWEDRGARVSTWLHRVALNLCYDRLRKKRGLPLEAAPEPEDPSPTAEARLTTASEEDELRAAIEELPDRQRAAIHLRHFEGRSNPEIADALEVSVEAVESLLARGRRALKARLAERDRT